MFSKDCRRLVGIAKCWECAATQRKKGGSLGKVLATLEKILKNSHATQDRRKGEKKGK
jgi:hypothetical protein